MVKGEVVGTVDPYTLQKERAVGRPFVLVASAEAAPPCGSEQPIVERDRGDFSAASVSVSGGLRAVGDTVCDTDVTSATYSGQPYRKDDTGQETTVR